MAEASKTATKATPEKTATKATPEKVENRTTIIIPKPSDSTGNDSVVVGLNGNLYHIKYDIPVDVPAFVAKIVYRALRLKAKVHILKENAQYKAGKSSIADL